SSVMPPPPAARQRILDAARRRFAADGVYAATLEEVRRDAGVSVGAVYHHFPDKERLAEAVWLDALERYQAGFLEALRAHPDARGGVMAAVEHHLRWVAAHRDDAALLLSARPAAAAARNRAFFAAVRAWWPERGADRAVVTLHEPERLNALSAAVVRQLRDALEDLAADPAIRAVVLTGADPGFSAGGDLEMMKAAVGRLRDPADEAGTTDIWR